MIFLFLVLAVWLVPLFRIVFHDAFFQKVDACGGNVHIWYITKQYIYGGLNGVKMNITGAPHVLARGAGSIAINPVTAEWYAKTDPPRDANPA